MLATDSSQNTGFFSLLFRLHPLHTQAPARAACNTLGALHGLEERASRPRHSTWHCPGWFSTTINPQGTTGNSKLFCPHSQPLPHQGFLGEVNHVGIVGIRRNPWSLPESRPVAASWPSPQGKALPLAHVTPLIIPWAWSPTITEHLSRAAPTRNLGTSCVQPSTGKC